MRWVPKMAAAVAIEEPTAIEPRSKAFLPLGVDRVDSHDEEEVESDMLTLDCSRHSSRSNRSGGGGWSHRSVW